MITTLFFATALLLGVPITVAVLSQAAMLKSLFGLGSHVVGTHKRRSRCKADRADRMRQLVSNTNEIVSEYHEVNTAWVLRSGDIDTARHSDFFALLHRTEESIKNYNEMVPKDLSGISYADSVHLERAAHAVRDNVLAFCRKWHAVDKELNSAAPQAAAA